MRWAAVLAALAVIGCSAEPERVVVRKPVEVKVPVVQKPKPPERLLGPVATEPLPAFIAPTDERATSALSPTGERQLKHLLLRMDTRIRAWETWGTSEQSE